MISNYEFLVQNYIGILNYPILISILPILAGSLIYIFGKIRSSNYWQYHLDNKYVPFLHGIVIINNFVFIPIILLLLFYYLYSNPKNLLNYGVLSVVALIIVLNVIQTWGKQLINWKKAKEPENTEKHLNVVIELISNWKEYLKLILLRGIFPLILYLLIFVVLKNTENKLVLLLIGFVWLLAMMFFSTVDAITEQHKTHEIRLKNKEVLKNTKIIEFLNEGNLLKYQEEDSTVKVIPIENVSEIILSKKGGN